MFHMGPHRLNDGAGGVFFRYAPEKISFAIDRYHRECRRLFELLDARLADHEYLAGDYSIADIANWSWVHTYPWAHLDALGAHLESHGGAWIAGDRFTLADVSWVVILDRLVEADWGEYFWGAGRRPAVAAYWGRLQARPSFGSAIESVRSPITRQGIADLAAAKRDDARLRAALEEGEPGR